LVILYLEQFSKKKIGGGMLFTRFLLSYVWETTLGGVPSTEWLRGEKLCTFRGNDRSLISFSNYLFLGNYHLAWSVPMADPTYVIPGAAIHSFMMFAPFFALYEKKGMVIQGVFLFVFGPYIAGVITPNLMEQASIWCFFSIAQISIMLFFIRETLIINWVRISSDEVLLISQIGKRRTSPIFVEEERRKKGEEGRIICNLNLYLYYNFYESISQIIVYITFTFRVVSFAIFFVLSVVKLPINRLKR
jgi:hypothetical protein